jgi:DNA-binding protein YbaB
MGILEQAKQVMQMRREASRIQAEIERITYTYENGGIACDIRGDFTVTAIRVSPEVVSELTNGKKQDRFNTMLLNVVNGAISGVKKKTQDAMTKMMSDSGMAGGLFGK